MIRNKDVYAIISTKAIATTLSAQSFFDILNISIYCSYSRKSCKICSRTSDFQ